MGRKTKGRAFTLVELMVVIVIIAFVIALLFPALRAARRKADAMGCASNLRQLGIACATYITDFNGYFPAVATTSRYGPSGRQIIETFRPWPAYFIHARYLDNRKIYYCKSADAVENLTVSDPNLPDTDPAYNTNDWDGGTYGMNIGLSCNIFGVARAGGFFPVQISQVESPGETVLMADRLVASKTSPGGTTIRFNPMATFVPEVFKTECALWGIPWDIDNQTPPTGDWNYCTLEFRHPGRTANILFCDFHVGSLKINAQGMFMEDSAVNNPRNDLHVSDPWNYRWCAYAKKPAEWPPPEE